MRHFQIKSMHFRHEKERELHTWQTRNEIKPPAILHSLGGFIAELEEVNKNLFFISFEMFGERRIINLLYAAKSKETPFIEAKKKKKGRKKKECKLWKKKASGIRYEVFVFSPLVWLARKTSLQLTIYVKNIPGSWINAHRVVVYSHRCAKDGKKKPSIFFISAICAGECVSASLYATTP